MFKIFTTTMSKPLIILAILLVVIIVYIMLSSAVTTVANVLGLETKESLIIKEAATSAELKKVIELTKENERIEAINDEIESLTRDSIIADVISSNDIVTEEKRIINEIANTTTVVPPIIVPPVVTDIKAPVDRVVIRDTTLTPKHKVALNNILARSKQIGVSK